MWSDDTYQERYVHKTGDQRCLLVNIDCTERPRKVGAKFNGKDIQADEIIQDFNFDYDAKRDRWNGFV